MHVSPSRVRMIRHLYQILHAIHFRNSVNHPGQLNGPKWCTSGKKKKKEDGFSYFVVYVVGFIYLALWTSKFKVQIQLPINYLLFSTFSTGEENSMTGFCQIVSKITLEIWILSCMIPFQGTKKIPEKPFLPWLRTVDCSTVFSNHHLYFIDKAFFLLKRYS